jgi:hypothetical protein
MSGGGPTAAAAASSRLLPQLQNTGAAMLRRHSRSMLFYTAPDKSRPQAVSSYWVPRVHSRSGGPDDYLSLCLRSQARSAEGYQVLLCLQVCNITALSMQYKVDDCWGFSQQGRPDCTLRQGFCPTSKTQHILRGLWCLSVLRRTLRRGQCPAAALRITGIEITVPSVRRVQGGARMLLTSLATPGPSMQPLARKKMIRLYLRGGDTARTT